MYTYIKEQFSKDNTRKRKIQAMTLSEIAEVIREENERYNSQLKNPQLNKEHELNKIEENCKTTPNSSTWTDEENNIIAYLRGTELSETKLNEYLGKSSPKLKKIIELCLKLWDLDGDTNNSYAWMNKTIKESSDYASIQNSELAAFLKRMCDKSVTKKPIYWIDIPGKERKERTLKTISNAQKP
jgi:hypothetical protein